MFLNPGKALRLGFLASASLLANSHASAARDLSLQEPRTYLPPSKRMSIPSMAHPALNYSTGRMEKFAIRLPVRGRPEIFEQISGNYYRTFPWKRMELRHDAPAAALYCWHTIISGGTKCVQNIDTVLADRSIPLPKVRGELDLLEYARSVNLQYGTRIARDALYHKASERDLSQGKLENRILKTTKDKRLNFSDSFANLSRTRKSKVGIFVIYGLDVTNGASPAREMMRNAAKHADDLGFFTKVLHSHPYGSNDVNAALLAPQIVEYSQQVDHVVIVAASKGVADTLRTLIVHEDTLLRGFPKRKLKLMVALSGVAQKSFIADWLLHGRTPTPFFIRNYLRSRPGDVLAALRSLAEGPWNAHSTAELGSKYPNLKWISLSMFPEGADGHVHISRMADYMREAVTRAEEKISPSDGLVETAATFLPPGTGVPQYIVRAFGSHPVSPGVYVDGTPLSPVHQQGRQEIVPEAGGEIIDAFLRAMPNNLLN